MNANIIHWESWALETETNKRFRRIYTGVGFALLVLAILVPMLDLGIPEKPLVMPEKDKVELAQLLPDERPVAEQVQEEPEEPKLQPSAPKSQTVEKEPAAPNHSARQIAEQSGLLQLRDQLADLRDNRHAPDAPQTLITSTSSAKSSASRTDLASDALAHSAGVAGISGGVSGGANAATLGTRRTGAVQSAFNGSGAATGSGGERSSAGRTLQEIQLIFDRSKGAFDAIFTRTARETSGMDAGKVSISLTIAPDGSVVRCDIVSSSFNNAEFEQKILQRVKTLNFGAKNVPTFTFQNYSLNFLLS